MNQAKWIIPHEHGGNRGHGSEAVNMDEQDQWWAMKNEKTREIEQPVSLIAWQPEGPQQLQ